MARLFRDWMYLAIVRVLFPDSNAQFRAVSSRRNQEEGSVLACAEVLLEIVNWDLWCLVLIRYLSPLFLFRKSDLKLILERFRHLPQRRLLRDNHLLHRAG